MAPTVRSLPLDKIVIPTGRRPLGDVTDLARSIEEIGLLHPITVTSEMVLVAGLHRLEACRSLRWSKITAVILDLDEAHAELAELDENLVRQGLTVLQRAEMLARKKAIYEALYPQTRQGVAGGKASGASRRGARTTGTMSLVQGVAAKMGVSSRSVERDVQIATRIPQDVRSKLAGTPVANHKMGLLRLARLPVPEQRRVAERIATGEVESVRRAIVLETTERLNAQEETLPTGVYDVIVVDPPWQYDVERTEYPTMALEEIVALPIPKLAADSCVVWLWTTNAMMRQALGCLEAWGFREKTILTWLKTRSTLGNWLLNRTEHAILAVRGEPVVNLTTQTTCLTAVNREHSRKPDEFYELVEALCPGRRLELFARQSREGWTTWGAERKLFDQQTG